MKKTILISFCLSILLSLTVFGQDGNYVEVMRSVLSTEKKAAVADVMAFSKEEADAFWPLYNEFQQKLYEINTERYNLIMDFAENFEKMTDEKAAELLKTYLGSDLNEVKLRKAYQPKFQKVIGNKKTLRYYQTENKISVLVDYELASNIPLLE
jgi:hypothetical protein